MENLSLGDSLLVAVVGMLVVFFGLVILIVLINIMSRLTGNMGKKTEAAAPAATAPAAAAVPAVASLIKPDAKITAAAIDPETVAVLTAAIAATRGEGYPFKIRRIVRVNRT